MKPSERLRLDKFSCPLLRACFNIDGWTPVVVAAAPGLVPPKGLPLLDAIFPSHRVMQQSEENVYL